MHVKMRRALVILFVSSVTAAPQGYNYGQPVRQFPPPAATETFGFSSSSKVNYATSTPGPQPVNNYMPAKNQQYLPPPITYSSSQLGQTHYPSQLPQQTYLPSFNSYSPASATQYPVQSVPQPERNYLPPSNTFNQAGLTQQEPTKEYVPPKREMIVMKNFYVHTAPEDPEDDYEQQPIGTLNKHYRVVFIRAPVQKNAAEALKLVKPQDEEKTVIYVLTKKTDVSEVNAHIQSEPKPVSKPEVFFIRYKTKEEAEHAQHQIQAQYDALGGTSETSNEGVAPVHSVVGSLDSSEGHEPDTSESPNRQYLPASK